LAESQYPIDAIREVEMGKVIITAATTLGVRRA
jgi:hypothetical protein